MKLDESPAYRMARDISMNDLDHLPAKHVVETRFYGNLRHDVLHDAPHEQVLADLIMVLATFEALARIQHHNLDTTIPAPVPHSNVTAHQRCQSVERGLSRMRAEDRLYVYDTGTETFARLHLTLREWLSDSVITH